MATSAQRTLVEEYVLEIISRSRSTQARCVSLRTLDFTSESPRQLADAICETCVYLSQVALQILRSIDWSDTDALFEDLQLLRTADTLVRDLAAQLRYIEAATTLRLPWSVISAFQHLVSQLLPHTTVMLRPQWNYNYGSHFYDIRDLYLARLKAFRFILPKVDVKELLCAILTQPFHIVTFPSLERKNILLHSLLGHEIGHLLLPDFAQDRARFFTKSFKAPIQRHIRRKLRPEHLQPVESRITEQFLLVDATEVAFRSWSRAVRELLADFVGTVLFGPAALFSALDIATQQGLDLPPSAKTEYYPPWRKRLRLIWHTLDPEKNGYFPVPASVFPGTQGRKRSSRLNARYRIIKHIVEDRVDQEAIAENPLVQIAYEKVDVAVKAGIAAIRSNYNFQSIQATASKLHRSLPNLIERLDHGIPPNVIAESASTSTPAELVAIINAAWFHKIAWAHTRGFLRNAKQLEAWLKIRNRTNLLTLKAVEYASLALEYQQFPVEKGTH